jgi:hypothetical protein
MENTIEHLSIFYNVEDKPYWVIYRGANKSGEVVSSNTTVSDKELSWKKISDVMTFQPDGIYFIILKSSPNASGNNPSFSYSKGAYQAPASGIGGMAQMGGNMYNQNPHLYGIGSPVYLEIDKKNNEIKKLELENLALRNEIQLLKIEHKSKEKVSGIDKLFANEFLVGKVLDIFGNQTQAAGVAAIVQGSGGQTVNLSDMNEKQEKELSNQEIAVMYFERLQRIENAMPDLDLLETMEKLAILAETNPAKLKLALSFL